MQNLTRKEQLTQEANILYLNRNDWLMDPNHEYPTEENMTWFDKAQSSLRSILSKTTGMSEDEIDVFQIPYSTFKHAIIADLYWRTVEKCSEDVMILPDHTFQAIYAKRSENLQQLQDHSLVLDRPDIIVLSNTESKHPLFILEIISSPDEVVELQKLIRYMLITHEMYGLREVYGALANSRKIRFVKLNCDNLHGNQIFVTAFENFAFVSKSDQTKKVFTLIDYFVNSTLPNNLDAN